MKRNGWTPGVGVTGQAWWSSWSLQGLAEAPSLTDEPRERCLAIEHDTARA